MIIQHNSASKIEKVESYFGDDLLGCLCFASEGHDYNLANDVQFSYTLEVDENNILDMTRIWFIHNSDDLPASAESVIDDMVSNLGVDRSQVLDFLDGSDADHFDTQYEGGVGWYIQQSMGLIAHALGYDAAEDNDEQGVVYIAYCVGRDLVELPR